MLTKHFDITYNKPGKNKIIVPKMFQQRCFDFVQAIIMSSKMRNFWDAKYLFHSAKREYVKNKQT